MIFKALLGSVSMTFVLTLMFLKMPRWLAKPFMMIPPWLQSIIIHFGYGSWLGGVTGHIMGAFLSVPWYFISAMFLRPVILKVSVPNIMDLIGISERKDEDFSFLVKSTNHNLNIVH